MLDVENTLAEAADPVAPGTVKPDAVKRSIMNSIKLVSLCSLIMEKFKI